MGTCNMRNAIWAAALAASLAVLTPLAPAGETVDSMSMPFFFSCRADFPMGKTFYFSTTQKTRGGTTQDERSNAYRAFLAKTYNYPSDRRISCVFAVTGDLQARTESARQQTMENLRTAQFEVVETPTWKYTK